MLEDFIRRIFVKGAKLCWMRNRSSVMSVGSVLTCLPSCPSYQSSSVNYGCGHRPERRKRRCRTHSHCVPASTFDRAFQGERRKYCQLDPAALTIGRYVRASAGPPAALNKESCLDSRVKS